MTLPAPGAPPRVLELPIERPMPNHTDWQDNEHLASWDPRHNPSAYQAWTPLPGPDGRVALAPPGLLLCYNADGSVAWNFPRNGTAPAVPVQDGLLVEHDATLFHLDWSGNFRRVWVGPAPLTARPLFHDNAWFVATEAGLHRLKPA